MLSPSLVTIASIMAAVSASTRLAVASWVSMATAASTSTESTTIV